MCEYMCKFHVCVRVCGWVYVYVSEKDNENDWPNSARLDGLVLTSL